MQLSIHNVRAHRNGSNAFGPKGWRKNVTRQTPLRARPRKFRFPFTEEEKPAQFFIETKRVGRNKNAVMHSADK